MFLLFHRGLKIKLQIMFIMLVENNVLQIITRVKREKINNYIA